VSEPGFRAPVRTSITTPTITPGIASSIGQTGVWSSWTFWASLFLVIASLAFILWWPWHDWHDMNVVDGMPEGCFQRPQLTRNYLQHLVVGACLLENPRKSGQRLGEQLALKLGELHLTLHQARSNGLGGEVCATISLFGFEVGKTSDRFARHVHAHVLRCAVRVADESRHTTGVEDAIEVPSCRLGGIGVLIAFSLDVLSGLVGASSVAPLPRRPPAAGGRKDQHAYGTE
jgi:hypothetical protein